MPSMIGIFFVPHDYFDIQGTTMKLKIIQKSKERKLDRERSKEV
jgi:hypothetical protein